MEYCTDRKLTAPSELAEELERRELVPRIEMDRRLVKEKHRRLLRERHRKHGTLALAARQPIDATPCERSELELINRTLDRGDIVG